MTARHDLDRQLTAFLLEGPTELPDPSFDAVRDRMETTRQRVVIGPWRVPDMNNFAKVLIATAAVVAVAVVGINLLPRSQTGAGGQPPASPSAPPSSPSPSPTPSATPKSDQVDGDLQPGTYTAQLPVGDTLAVTFTVPGGWAAFSDPPGVLHGLLPTDDRAIAFQFRDVTTLKGDPCHWSGPDDDIRVGPTADDLVQALQEQTAYEASEPVDVMVGGYAGQRVDIVSPTEVFAEVNGATTAVGCDEGRWRFWDGEIYAQGPANRWQTNVLDVDGTRLVIVVQDFPSTSAADRAELDAVVDSMVIEP